MMNLIKFLITLIIFSSSIDGYSATKPEEEFVELKYEIKKSKHKQQKTTQQKKREAATPKIQYNCKVDAEPFIDLRFNQQTLGAKLDAALIAKDLPSWLETIRHTEIIEKTESWIGTKHLVVKPKLKKLYSYSEKMNIHSVVSMEIEFWINGTQQRSIYYRGIGSTFNTLDALDEYATTLNYAVQNIAPQIFADMQSLCTN